MRISWLSEKTAFAGAAVALAIVACSDDSGSSDHGSSDGADAAAFGGAGGFGVAGFPPSGAGGQVVAAAGGFPIVGMGGAGVFGTGGMGFGAGGMGFGGSDDLGSGGSPVPGAGGAPPPATGDPVIPAPNGACPTFTTGTQVINGLSTEIVAGAPGATKGPLLFAWHGTGGSGRLALTQLPQSVQSDILAQGGIVVAPSDNGQVREGRDVTLVLGVWYDTADLKFADQVVACAVQNHNIDPRRIYTTGCSAGGLMAGVMALERSQYVAAAAPNSGGVVGSLPLSDPAHVPAVMCMHGGSGDNVVVNFGETSAGFETIMKGAGSPMVIDCNHGRGHCGAPATLHENAWEFMKAHPFGVGTSPYAGGLPPTFPSYCTIK